MNIDLAWFNRGDLAVRPIRVRTTSQIEHEVRWGRAIRGLIFAGKVAAIVVGFIVFVSAIFLATP